MIKTDYLIIGGGIAGTTAAEIIRERDHLASITLISEESHPLYSRVLLPKFVQGKIGLEKVMLRTLSDYKKNRIHFYQSEVAKMIDVEKKRVKTTSNTLFSYQKLLIASGGKVRTWPHENQAPGNIFRFQTLDDAQRIIRFFKKCPKGEALVVGGGFITLELLEILVRQGYKVTLLMRDKRFWHDILDDTGFKILSDLWDSHTIGMLYCDEVASVETKGHRTLVSTRSGHTLEVDFIGVGIGLERNLDFVASQGLTLESQGESLGIEVNEYLEASVPDVWAAGDAAFYSDVIMGNKRLCRNWSGAFAQGRIAGVNMSGGYEPYRSAPRYSIGHLGSVITMIGNVLGGVSDKEAFCHFNEANKEYARIFESDGIISGAALINAKRLAEGIRQAIMNKSPIHEFRNS